MTTLPNGKKVFQLVDKRTGKVKSFEDKNLHPDTFKIHGREKLTPLGHFVKDGIWPADYAILGQFLRY